jgi:hypothetical protein
MKDAEIIARVRRGEKVPCKVCGEPLELVSDQVNPITVRCPEGHQSYSILWDAGPPTETSPGTRKCIWLEPVENLSFHQLNQLQQMLKLSVVNLKKMKEDYCDGKRHLLLKDAPAEKVAEIAAMLNDLSIAHSVQ